MAINPIVLRIVSQHQQAVAGVNQTTAAVKALGNAAQQSGKQAQQGARTTATAYKQLSSAWSPSIAALKQFQAQQRQAAAVSRQTTQGIIASQISLRSALQSTLRTAGRIGPALMRGSITGRQALAGMALQAQKLDTALGQVASRAERFQNIKNVLPGVQQASVGALGGAAGGTLLGSQAIAAAGKVQNVRAGFKTLLGSDQEADKLLDEVRKFARKSPYGFESTSGVTQTLLARGFGRDELMTVLEDLGNAVSAVGGGIPELEHAANQIAQIRSKGKAEMEDINSLSEGAKLPIIPILTKRLGAERVQKAMSGDEPFKSEEILPVLFDEFRKQFGTGMSERLLTINGQMEQFKDAVFEAAEIIGKNLVPAVSTVTGLLRKAVEAFNALPEPAQQFITYAGLTSTAFLGIVGAIGLLMTPLVNLGIFLMSLGGPAGAATAASTAVGGLSTTLGATGLTSAAGSATAAIAGSGGLIAALGLIAPAVLTLIAGLGAKLGIDKFYSEPLERDAEGANDTQGDWKSMSWKERAADFRRRAAEKRAVDTTAPKSLSLFGLTGMGIYASSYLTNKQGAKGREAEARSLEMQAARFERYGRQGRPTNAPSAAQVLSPSVVSAPSGMIPTGGGGDNVEALEDQIAAMTMAKSKDPQLAGMRNQLRLARRARTEQRQQAAAARRAARQTDAQRKKAQRDRDRAAKATERAAKAAAKLQERNAKAAERARKRQEEDDWDAEASGLNDTLDDYLMAGDAEVIPESGRRGRRGGVAPTTALLDHLRAGGSIFNFSGDATSSGINTGANSGGGGGVLQARIASQGYDAGGNWIVQFQQIVIPNQYAAAGRARG